MIISGQTYWRVGELAKLTGLTIRTLRYYDQIGLFSPSGYSEGGYRLYDRSDLPRLQQILALKELGLTLEETKAILADPGYDPLEVVTLQIARLRDQIGRQQRLMRALLNVSARMRAGEQPTVEGFAQLLSMMNQSHESYFAERRTSIDRRLDRLGGWLAGEAPPTPQEEERP
ncbi:MerR family transcriptional regulator [Cohnella sp. REN36]|nr:MerR family transcriptional regulator [Cohnella sp. REN36]MCC3375112.1 MerR family transcriptional regulator [Cohnella sp. REN36]